MKRLIALGVAVFALAAVTLPPAALAGEGDTAEETMVTSSADGTQIDITVFKPGSASATAPVPVILDSHGWGGSKNNDIDSFTTWLDSGFGVVSISQRGFGNSGGEANVQDPDLEAEDIESVIDYIAGLDWVEKDLDADGMPIADDPVLGAIGGSYGGGYQTMTALDELDEEGHTRLNAIAPEITWYDLNESLAPQKVVRTAWTVLLYAVGASALPQYVHEAFAYGAATGQWPDGTVLGTEAPVPNLDAEFHEHGPVAFAERGVKLDIPMLIRQGQSDNLFNLNQGIHIFQDALTDEARSQSYFVGFNGGHALPNAAPLGTPTAAELGGGVDACSGDWTQLRIDFFKAVFAGEDTTGLLPARYNMTNIDSEQCFSYDDFTTFEDIAVNEDLDPTGSNGMVSTAGAGAPINLPVANGPITVSGIPTLSGDVYSAVADTRAFFGLSMGTSPADAKVIGNNLMPLRRALPSLGEGFEIELPGITAEIPEGQQLFLTITPVSDMFFGHGSRTPGGFLLTDLNLRLPILER